VPFFTVASVNPGLAALLRYHITLGLLVHATTAQRQRGLNHIENY
jgi:hypothetical protein